MKKLIPIVFIVLAGTIILSCKKVTNPTPGPPVVTFKDLNITSREPKPIAYFHFLFSDPDGDIGLKNSDTTGSFAYGSPYYYDFHMKIFKYDTTTKAWLPGTIYYNGDTAGLWYYRIPYIDNQSKDKSLTGEVYVQMTGFRPVSTMKKFRYEFYIYDRAHNKSNVVTTPEFNYP